MSFRTMPDEDYELCQGLQLVSGSCTPGCLRVFAGDGCCQAAAQLVRQWESVGVPAFSFVGGAWLCQVVYQAIVSRTRTLADWQQTVQGLSGSAVGPQDVVPSTKRA